MLRKKNKRREGGGGGGMGKEEEKGAIGAEEGEEGVPVSRKERQGWQKKCLNTKEEEVVAGSGRTWAIWKKEGPITANLANLQIITMLIYHIF